MYLKMIVLCLWIDNGEKNLSNLLSVVTISIELKFFIWDSDAVVTQIFKEHLMNVLEWIDQKIVNERYVVLHD